MKLSDFSFMETLAKLTGIQIGRPALLIAGKERKGPVYHGMCGMGLGCSGGGGECGMGLGCSGGGGECGMGLGCSGGGGECGLGLGCSGW